MKIIWLPLAKDNLNRIYHFYAQYSASVALRVVDNILQRVVLLESHPAAGWVLEDLSEYSYVFRSLIAYKGRYKIIYYHDKNYIYIYAIWDCRRKPDDIFSK